METWDAIRARRNVRQYTDQPIAREHLERILEAGRRAPSAGNSQPWDFVVVTGRDQLTELAKVWERGGRHIAGSAATIALVAREPDGGRGRDLLMYDLGQATVYMMLAAADLGIGSGHSTRSSTGTAGDARAHASGQHRRRRRPPFMCQPWADSVMSLPGRAGVL